MKRLIFTVFCLSSIVCLQAQSPAIGGYNIYYGTLHNHTNVSDGTGTDDDAYNYAKNVAGMDYFSTSNHVGSIVEAEWAAIKAASDKYNEDSVFTAFWGFEWSGAGDVSVFNTDDYTTISNDPSGTFVELCAWLDARDCVAFFNHPGRGGSVHFNGFATPPCYKIVGMELFNKALAYDVYYYNDGFYPNDGNLSPFAEANIRGWRIGASGGDDNHGGTWGTRTDYRMAILSEHLTRPELYAAMQARRFYSTLDKNLALSFKIDSSEMGSSIEGGAYDMQIQASDMNEESFTRVMLFRDGLEMNTWNIDSSAVDLTFPLNAFDGEFFYVKVTQADGDEAISSPIYVQGGIFNIRPSCSISAPENGTHFSNPQLITITAEASDADGTVASVEFYVDGSSLGSDTLAPYSINYTFPADGSYEITAKVTDDVGTWVTSSPLVVTVGIFSKTENSRINDGNNDVEEAGDGSMYTNSSDIEIVDEGTNNQTIGLRFPGLNIPPGASIQSAHIQFTVDEVSTGTCVLSIKGHNVDDSQSFSTTRNNVSGRITTSAEVVWEPAEWPSVGAAGQDQRTPDLSSIIQEIVNRPGYTLSSAITIIITGTGERTAEAYEGSSSGSAALLSVNYAFGMESSVLTPLFDETPIRIYPNPVSDGKVTIEFDADIDDLTSVSIYDISGRICHRSQIENNMTVIDVSRLKSGLYIINLSNNNKVISHKLIVE
ncbi:Ig-like domain-containing protein [Bacteroidota bacterium]